METTRQTASDDYVPRDYRLERWLAIIFALMFLIPVVASGQIPEPTPAEAGNPLPTTTLATVEDGSLLFKTTSPGVYAIAPMLRTEVSIKVTGPVVRTTVRQTFRNTTGKCTEGVYIFPLPEMSAVDSLHMSIGARLIVGEIK